MTELSPHSPAKRPWFCRRSTGIRIGASIALVLAGFAVARSPARALEISPAVPPPATTPRADEEILLRDAANYLQLTRAQVSQLLIVARGTHRRLRLFYKEEAERPPADSSTPAAKTPAAAAVEQRKAQVADEIARYAAPLMARILSREQIALAWRLTTGEPPKFAQVSPALLTPQAGFVSRSRTVALGDEVELVLFARRFRVQEQRDMELVVDRGSLSANVERVISGRNDGEWVRSGGTGPWQGLFPQRVIESDDLAELVPAIEPVARRLFTSEKWLAELEDRQLAGPFFERGVGASRRPPLGTLTRVRDYRMERGFEDQAGRGPDLQPLGGQMQNGAYLFGPGQGLRLANAGVTDHYALQFTFRADARGNYQKLVDFKDGARDDGLYLYQGHLTFYRHAEGGAPQPGAEHRLRIERNRHTRIVRGYLDYRPIFAFIDLDDAAVFQQGKGLFFVDDRETSGKEQGPGSLRWLTFYAPPRR